MRGYLKYWSPRNDVININTTTVINNGCGGGYHGGGFWNGFGMGIGAGLGNMLGGFCNWNSGFGGFSGGWGNFGGGLNTGWGNWGGWNSGNNSNCNHTCNCNHNSNNNDDNDVEEFDGDTALIKTYEKQVDNLIANKQSADEAVVKFLYNAIEEYYKSPYDPTKQADNIADYKNLMDRLKMTFPYIGSDGNNGANGNSNTNGIDGADGTNGANGNGNTNGIDGADGTNGANGNGNTNGSDGADGTNGANGNGNTNGSDGADGTNGANGNDGSYEGITGLTNEEVTKLKEMNIKVITIQIKGTTTKVLSLPSALTIDNLKALAKIANKHGLKVAVGHNKGQGITDPYIAGTIDPEKITEKEGKISYEIDCTGVGKFEGTYKVFQKEEDGEKSWYIDLIKYTGTTPVWHHEQLYKFNEKRGMLERDGDPVTSSRDRGEPYTQFEQEEEKK